MFVSVVLPSFNRATVLQKTLAMYERQAGVDGHFEVIVVDDASTDDTQTVIATACRNVTYLLRTRRLERNSGPAYARNLALDLAEGDLILFSGDDILPSDDFVACHRNWHLHKNPHEEAAMVGRITWADDMAPTALLRWLQDMGTQFHYGDMRDGASVPLDRFYTSNVSVKRSFLDKTGQRFDERMRFCEDSELSSRLGLYGMTLHYNASAHGRHLHPTNLSSSLRRMHSLGLAVAEMEMTSPETFKRVTAGVLDRDAGWRERIIRALLCAPLQRWLYRPLAALCERNIFADRLFALTHASSILQGVQQGRRSRGL